MWTLDLGCGNHPSIEAGASLVGVDFSIETLCAAKREHADILFVCAQGEHLPFRAGAFARVVSNVSLPYMHIPQTVSEISRVLSPGGEVALQLHPLSFTLGELSRSLRRGRFTNTLYRMYVIFNGLLLFLGINLRIPAGKRRCESFQPRSAMRRILSKNEFVSISLPYRILAKRK